MDHVGKLQARVLLKLRINKELISTIKQSAENDQNDSTHLVNIITKTSIHDVLGQRRLFDSIELFEKMSLVCKREIVNIVNCNSQCLDSLNNIDNVIKHVKYVDVQFKFSIGLFYRVSIRI